MSDLDKAWDNFLKNKNVDIIQKKKICKHIPKCSNIYISTQTKIAFMNQVFDLEKIFWKLSILKYQERQEGILKKQMKINCNTQAESERLEERIKKEEMVIIDVISKIDNPNARRIKYKDIRKINVGIAKKDLTSYRKKRKGAFYNCIVLIMRLKMGDKFKEVHLKLFNTGKLEIPGIQSNIFLYKALDKLITILQPFCENTLFYNAMEIETVLINSNFSCDYYIDRNILYNILKYNYKIAAIYDPCSYPGIQCKFYYNKNNTSQNGLCNCVEKCSKKGGTGEGPGQCLSVSFMIFRTGSVLIVGHCDEQVIMIVYDFLKDLLARECPNIYTHSHDKIIKTKTKKIWKKYILSSIQPVNKTLVSI